MQNKLVLLFPKIVNKDRSRLKNFSQALTIESFNS